MNRSAQAAMCDGKEPFASPTLAHTINKRRRKSGKLGVVYRCICCGSFHIGRPIKAATAMNKNQGKSYDGAGR